MKQPTQSTEPYASMSANIDSIPAADRIWDDLKDLIETAFNNHEVEHGLPKRVENAQLWVKSGIVPKDDASLQCLQGMFESALKRHGIKVYDSEPRASILHEHAPTIAPVELVLDGCHIISDRKVKELSASLRKLGGQMIEFADLLDNVTGRSK